MILALRRILHGSVGLALLAAACDGAGHSQVVVSPAGAAGAGTSNGGAVSIPMTSGGATGAGAGQGGTLGAGGASPPAVAGGTTTNGGASSAGAAGGGAPGAAGSRGGTSNDAGAGGRRGMPSYLLGADITFVQADEAAGVTYSDGTTRDVLALLAEHGFNAIRLRTFVDPKASDGYDRQQGFGDLTHTLAFGKRIKGAGMTFFLDFHYSDNWADPGKQCIPVSWQGLSLAEMASAVHDYTKDSITRLVAGGARPDLVQLGNEITPGMLIHVCDANGQPIRQSAVNGSTASWSNLGTLLKAAVSGVREVDGTILIALHVDRCGDKPTDDTGTALAASVDWITRARKEGVAFDAFAESCYQAFQGDPSSTDRTKRGFESTLSGLASRFPDLRLLAAEYGAMEREINDVVYGLPGGRGFGSFYWEPTRETQGNVGHALFTTSGNPRRATPDLSLYDAMKTAYAPRL